MHLCAELTASFLTLEPFGEIGANFSLQLSSRTRFDKINKKKVIAENQCEKHKKSSLVLLSQVLSNCVISYFKQLIVMNFHLQKPYYPYFFTPIIPTFSLLFQKILSLLFPHFSVDGHLKACCLVLVQPGKTHPDITEKLLTGT